MSPGSELRQGSFLGSPCVRFYLLFVAAHVSPGAPPPLIINDDIFRKDGILKNRTLLRITGNENYVQKNEVTEDL
jgi:hypothetical protein